MKIIENSFHFIFYIWSILILKYEPKPQKIVLFKKNAKLSKVSFIEKILPVLKKMQNITVII